MELIYLKTLLRLYELGNYSQTAEALGYSQSSISTHIQRLEQIYGGKIICKSGSRLALTAKGKIICRYAKQVLDVMEKMDRALRIEEVCEINIGTIESIALYYLDEIIEAYKNKYPGIAFHLSIEEESVLIQKLRRQELDFALVLDREIKSGSFKALCLKQEGLCFVYGEKTGACEDILNGLEEREMILTGEECPYRKALLEGLASRGLKCRVSMTLSNVDTIKRLVSNGWGIGFLPRFTIRPGDALGAVPYEMANPFYIQLLYGTEMEEKPEYRDFIRIAQSSIHCMKKEET
jgi:DNA-binding transcriptional LysR family regulator